MTYNLVPYNYTVGVTKRFKGLDLINSATQIFTSERMGNMIEKYV